jgi:hypothetical protein
MSRHKLAAHGHPREQTACPALPDDILPNVLRFVDLQQRLGRCARVSHTWQAAAAAATTELHCAIEVQRYDPLMPMRKWLSRYGAKRVQSIDLFLSDNYSSREFEADIKLPFAQLQQLCSLSLSSISSRPPNLQCWDGQQAGSSTSSSQSGVIVCYQAGRNGSRRGIAGSDDSQPESDDEAHNPFEHVSSTLTSLKLHDIELDWRFHAGWCCLAALTALQQLHLRQAEYACTEGNLAEVLPQLTRLTKLHLEWTLDGKLRAALGLLPLLILT